MMKLSNNKIFKNASWIILCRIVQSLLSLIIGTISARYLGPSNYGLINYASSITAFAVPIVQLGLRNILVQEIVSKPEDEGKILGTSIGMSTIASLLGMIGIVSFASIVNRTETDTIIVCALYSISLIFQMTEMLQYWFQAKYLSKYTSITSLAAYVVVSMYKIYLLITGKSIFWFALTSAFDYAIISIILYIIYRYKGNEKLSFSWKLGKRLLSKSKYYIVSGMMVTFFSQTDKVMLKVMNGDEANGIYSAALVCAGLISFVYTAIIDSFRPIIFLNKKNSEEAYEKKLVQLYSIIIYMGLAQSLIFTLLSKYIIIVLYGYEYIAASSVLSIITWYIAFSYMGTIRNIWMLAENKQNILWIINLSGALLNIICNYMLIPILGAEGAAIASLFTQIFTNFVLCVIIKDLRPNFILIIRALNIKTLLEIVPWKSKRRD